MSSSASLAAIATRRHREPERHREDRKPLVRLTAFQREAAVQEASRLMADCLPYSTVVVLMERRYDLSTSAAKRLVQTVYENWEAECPESRHYRWLMLRAQLRSLYSRASKQGNLEMCLKVVDRLARLEGFDVTRVQASVTPLSAE